VLTWFRERFHVRTRATELYGAVVAQARDEMFYGVCGVNDTAEGRYELIVLHLFLLLERLRIEGKRGAPLARGLVEAFVTDMDDAMREMGVGDLSVPKKVRRAAAGLYERVAAYRAASEPEGEGELMGLIGQLLPAGAGHREAFGGLAAYIRAAERHLAGIPFSDIEGGRISFPSYGLPLAERGSEGGRP
jgi:cytochrome b pre-mRNA-processing protein 3